jgi:hypothetical protein
MIAPRGRGWYFSWLMKMAYDLHNLTTSHTGIGRCALVDVYRPKRVRVLSFLITA